ncbi:MAG TPA: DEAD/DEAH box helicase [Allosphingosinicella sp.]|nr:DEAD/DEAH box helicase [Allosphingosinicella sp.]
MTEQGSYDRLHPEIRRWIRDQGWTELRAVQDQAIRAILDGDGDVLVSATTAAGKTEAAFLPLLSQAKARADPGLAILYVSPLKALINDQYRRLELLSDRLELPVTRWHGDAPQSAKQRLIKRPAGVALITPESIEALFTRRPSVARSLFERLDAILIDELHAFLQGPRGLHLASLVQRIDAIAARRPRRVGLSATIGDLALAARWLCPQNPSSVALVEAGGGRPELQLQIRGYRDPPEASDVDALEDEGSEDTLSQVADHMFGRLRGSNNLAFAGSRRSVEALADRLRRRSERAGVPNEFFPHHGSLARELREDLEMRLKTGDLPTTAIATTTLELGIDIGSVVSIAQVGAPRSLASLRQRLGRSGRREGTPAVLRIYVREKHVDPDSDPLDHLRLPTVRAQAAVQLLLEQFVEPPVVDPSLATVVLHQTLSVIVERGGAQAANLYRLICAPGPLADLTKADYAELLRGAAAPGVALIEQAPDGTIMLGAQGEWLTSGRDFYAIFESDEEWRLVAGGRLLGTIPLSNVIGVGSIIGFAGRRWRVTAVDDRAKVVEVVSHPAGRLPKFDRLSTEPIHDRLAREMRSVLCGTDIPPYLDREARSLLAEGRAAYAAFDLRHEMLLSSGRDTHVFTWQGTAVNSVLSILFIAAGLECEVNDVGVTVADSDPDEVRAVVKGLQACPPIEDLADFVGNLRLAKYDDYVPEPLLRRLWARRNAATRPEAQQVLQMLRGA